MIGFAIGTGKTVLGLVMVTAALLLFAVGAMFLAQWVIPLFA